MSALFILPPRAEISLAQTAWIETAANGGDDATGEVGNPAQPFETALAAWDAARGAGAQATLVFGYGAHAAMTLTGAAYTTAYLNIMGAGAGCSWGGVTWASDPSSNTLYLQDVGVHSVTITSIAMNGTAGANGGAEENGTSGNPGGVMSLTNCAGGTLSATGGRGGDGGSSEAITLNGGDGGTGGNITLRGCYFSSALEVNGADGGNGGTGTIGTDGNGGNTGSAGTIDALDSETGDLRVQAGTTPGVSFGGGSGGAVGNGGSINITQSRVNSLYLDGSVGGSFNAILSRLAGYSGNAAASSKLIGTYETGAVAWHDNDTV